VTVFARGGNPPPGLDKLKRKNRTVRSVIAKTHGKEQVGWGRANAVRTVVERPGGKGPPNLITIRTQEVLLEGAHQPSMWTAWVPHKKT